MVVLFQRLVNTLTLSIRVPYVRCVLFFSVDARAIHVEPTRANTCGHITNAVDDIIVSIHHSVTSSHECYLPRCCRRVTVHGPWNQTIEPLLKLFNKLSVSFLNFTLSSIVIELFDFNHQRFTKPIRVRQLCVQAPRHDCRSTIVATNQPSDSCRLHIRLSNELRSIRHMLRGLKHVVNTTFSCNPVTKNHALVPHAAVHLLQALNVGLTQTEVVLH